MIWGEVFSGCFFFQTTPTTRAQSRSPGAGVAVVEMTN